LIGSLVVDAVQHRKACSMESAVDVCLLPLITAILDMIDILDILAILDW
jgi:hypothetical protein